MSAPEASGAPSEGTLRFEVVSGNAAGSALVVEERLVIGRQSESLGRLGDDPELSRHHAEISRQPDGTFVIEDLGSTNGTEVNGSPISAPTVLAQDDAIELGGTSIVVTQVPSVAPEPPTAARPATHARAETLVVDVPPDMRESPPPAAPEPHTVESPAPPPRLELRLMVDPALREAEIQLDDQAEPIRLVYRDGRWQPAA